MKAYLGDSVYVERDGYGIVLTTENGYGPSNTIVLEPDVLDSLLGFVARVVAGDGAKVERLRAERLRAALRASPPPAAPEATFGGPRHDEANPWPPMDAHGSHSPLAETIREEMAARGWTEEWVMERLGDPVEAVAFQMLLAAHNDRLTLSADSAEKLGRVFGVSPQLFLNLDATTRRIGYAMAPAPASAHHDAPGERTP